MKRLFLLVISTLFFLNFCFAQSKPDSAQGDKKHTFAVSGGYGKRKIHKKDSIRRFTFGFNYGYGLPIGSFAKADDSRFPISHFNGKDTSHLGGYAKYGFHYEYFFAYRVYRRLTIMASVSGSDFGYDINALNAQYIKFFPPNTDVVTSGDNYYVLEYLIGPNWNIRLSKYFSIDLKALGGLASTNYPTLSYISLTESALYSFPTGNGFGYNLGAGLKFTTAEGLIGVHLNASYAGSNVNFPGYSVAYYTPQTNNPATSNQYLGSAIGNTSRVLDVSILTITLGLTVEL